MGGQPASERVASPIGGKWVVWQVGMGAVLHCAERACPPPAQPLAPGCAARAPGLIPLPRCLTPCLPASPLPAHRTIANQRNIEIDLNRLHWTPYRQEPRK